MHVESKMYLVGKTSSSETDRSAFKFELSENFSSGMFFKIIPKYKTKSEGEPISYKDKIHLVNIKLTGFIGFSGERSIDLDRPVDIKNFKSVCLPVLNRKNDENSTRFEANLSLSQEISWRLCFHGKDPSLDENKILRGGNLVRIRHNETGSFLAAQVSFSTKKMEAFLRIYEGEYTEEINSVSTLWEVEYDKNIHRGAKCLLFDEGGNPIKYRLRHYLTGRALTFSEDVINGRKILLAHLENAVDEKGSLMVIKSFFNGPEKFINYDVAYSLALNEGKASLQYYEYILYLYNNGLKTVADQFTPSKDSEFGSKKYVNTLSIHDIILSSINNRPALLNLKKLTQIMHLYSIK